MVSAALITCDCPCAAALFSVALLVAADKDARFCRSFQPNVPSAYPDESWWRSPPPSLPVSVGRPVLPASEVIERDNDRPRAQAIADLRLPQISTRLRGHPAVDAPRGSPRRPLSSQTATRPRLRDTHPNSSTVVPSIDHQTRFVVIMKGAKPTSCFPRCVRATPRLRMNATNSFARFTRSISALSIQHPDSSVPTDSQKAVKRKVQLHLWREMILKH